MKKGGRMMTHSLFGFLTVIGILVCLCTGPVNADEDGIGNPPWHLVDYWWDFGEPVAFQSYSLDVTISDEVDSAIRFYIAPVGLGYLSGEMFYGGIQTNSDGFESHPHQQRQYIGRGGIFSRWHERGLQAVRRSYGGLFESGGYEGDFVSVRNRFEWGTGRYTYSIRNQGTQEVDGKSYTWVGAFVYSHDEQQEQYIGSLRFEGAELELGRQLASFVEIYGGLIPYEKIPKVTITFENWRVNGKPIVPVSASANYPVNVPPYLHSKVEGSKVHAICGEPVDRENQEGLVKTDHNTYYESLFTKEKETKEEGEADADS
jgi:hypothetical protein